MTIQDCDLAGWTVLIEQHLRQYPRMTARDVYKMIYQGVLGPEHLMPSVQIFADRLQTELAALQPGRGEPMIEPVRPDGGLNRINLRAWLGMQGDISGLLEACLAAGRRAWGTRQDLLCVWKHFFDLVGQEHFSTIYVPEVKAFQAWLEANDYPAVHHSEAYTATYAPAYRLIAQPDSLA